MLSTKTLKRGFILEQLSAAFRYAASEANIRFEILDKELIYRDGRIQLPIIYSGFDGIYGAPKKIHMDFAMDMQPYGEQHPKKIVPTYSDLGNHCMNINVQTLNTIFANKIGLLVDNSRNEPRDLYDIWFLFGHLKQFDFNKKKLLKTIKQKYGFIPPLSVLTAQLKNNVYRARWNIRLEKQMANLPDLELVLETIGKFLGKLLTK